MDAIKTAKRQEAERVRGVKAKAELLSKTIDEVRAAKRHEMALKKAKEQMKKMDKIENLERLKRIKEFVRLQTLQKIDEDSVRSKKLKKQREKLIQSRKAIQVEQKRRKHLLQESLRKVSGTTVASILLLSSNISCQIMHVGE